MQTFLFHAPFLRKLLSRNEKKGETKEGDAKSKKQEIQLGEKRKEFPKRWLKGSLTGQLHDNLEPFEVPKGMFFGTGVSGRR